ncbi:MAG: DegV family protein, partial [Clostridia bacterium]|nr:DegV family protein [Clostridia bacterium]
VDVVIKVDKKVRGYIRPATLKYAKGLEEGILNAEEDFVFITHAGTSQEIIDDVHAYLDSLHHFKNVFVTLAVCVISAHCGYGTLGVLFISK